MFCRIDHIVRSDILNITGVCHAFATRFGGVSVLPETASMNTAVRMGDTPENVAENIGRLAKYAGLDGIPVIYGHQIHSTEILTVTTEDVMTDPDTRECDGYITDYPGIALMVRAADCLPILFCGERPDGAPVIAAVHAGWRGTVNGIAAAAVERMCGIGVVRESIRVGIGPAIRDCCFEVQADFIESVRTIAGTDFADRHIHRRDGRYYVSLQDMNLEILEGAGIRRENIDISPDCTAHMSDIYHSHRATVGKRGAGGGIIGIVNHNEGS